MLVDSHCHLTDPRFDGDRTEVLQRARDAGVERIVTVCSDRADGERIRALLDAPFAGVCAPALWGTAGVHPHAAQDAEGGDLDALLALARSHPRVVAVGETGLDFHYDTSPRDQQERLFREHLEGAAGLDLPVVVHSRSADALMSRILREWSGRVHGVLHCYTGGAELMDTALGAGWMISFTGIITFGKYHGGDLVRQVPRERLMVETDAPYLAPAPVRGRRNEPALVARVAEVLALLRGEPLEEVREYTTENAVRFYGLAG